MSDISNIDNTFSLGQRIEKLLKDKGISLRELSRLIDIPASTLHDILNDKVDPGCNKIKKIAECLNIDLDWLINGISYIERMQEKSDIVVAESTMKYGANINQTIIEKLKKLKPEYFKIIEDLIDFYLKK